MKPSLQLRLGHQLTMTPQLQQAIRLLQLSALDLKSEIQAQLESNTMLELPEEETVEESPFPDTEMTATPWENQMGYSPLPSPNGGDIDTNTPTAITLTDHLYWQMQLTPFSDSDRLIAAAIIDGINDDGFLSCNLEEIVATVKQVVEVEFSEVEAVLHRIQQFDPLGVGARDLSECLKVQLDHLPDMPLKKKARELVCRHLPLLARHDYAALRRRLGLTFEELQSVIHCIQSLNPRPGTEIGNRTPEYVLPDVCAYKKNGQWEVDLNPDCTPPVQINRTYAALIQHCHSSADTHFLRTQLQEARWFLKSIENRNETLLKVARAIVKRQQCFLDYGEEAMKPMILHDIAAELELHESTISRVTTQKYLYTPRGTFELKYFFSSHVSTREGGECSATAIRALIKKLISGENPKKPLSDSQLAKKLSDQGIQVARRTIAKYREAMTIPPSNERKQLF